MEDRRHHRIVDHRHSSTTIDNEQKCLFSLVHEMRSAKRPIRSPGRWAFGGQWKSLLTGYLVVVSRFG
jgi:hypothetical protein